MKTKMPFSLFVPLAGFAAIASLVHAFPSLSTSGVGVVSTALTIVSIIHFELINLGVHANYLVALPKKKHFVHIVLITLSCWLIGLGLLQVYAEVYQAGSALHKFIMFGYLSFYAPAIPGMAGVTYGVRWNTHRKNRPNPSKTL